MLPLCSSWLDGVEGGWSVCTTPTTASAGLEESRAGRGGGGGVGRLGGFKGAVVHLPVPPLGLTRCESLPGGIVNATELITSCYLYAAFTESHGCVTCTAKVAGLGRNQEQSCKEARAATLWKCLLHLKIGVVLKVPCWNIVSRFYRDTEFTASHCFSFVLKPMFSWTPHMLSCHEMEQTSGGWSCHSPGRGIDDVMVSFMTSQRGHFMGIHWQLRPYITITWLKWIVHKIGALK